MTSQGATTLVEELEQAAKDSEDSALGFAAHSPYARRRYESAAALRARAARIRELEQKANEYPLAMGYECRTIRALTGPLPGPSGGAGDSKRRETKP